MEKVSVIIPTFNRFKYLLNTIESVKNQTYTNLEIIEEGDYAVCAVSGKNIMLNQLTYWNVELQEAYFSFIEANSKRNKN